MWRLTLRDLGGGIGWAGGTVGNRSSDPANEARRGNAEDCYRPNRPIRPPCPARPHRAIRPKRLARASVRARTGRRTLPLRLKGSPRPTRQSRQQPQPPDPTPMARLFRRPRAAPPSYRRRPSSHLRR